MKFLIPSILDRERLDRVVAVATELPRSTVATLVADGNVTLNGKIVTKVSHRVDADQTLVIAVPETGADCLVGDATVPFTVVYEDDDVVVVDKPAGVVVHPGAGTSDHTLVHGLIAKYPELNDRIPGGDAQRPGIVHRLDAGTSGLLMVARTQRAHESLVAALQQRDVERRYLTLLWGALTPAVGMVDAPIGRSQQDRTKMAVSAKGKLARTRYQVLAHVDNPSVSWVAVKLETGRTHQIRVHMTAIGHPVVGDRRYNGNRQGLDMHRPFLHAYDLRFTHPVTGELNHQRSPLPPDLLEMVRALGLESHVPEPDVDELAGNHVEDEVDIEDELDGLDGGD